MEVARDLIRDLVGILFPGGLGGCQKVCVHKLSDTLLFAGIYYVVKYGKVLAVSVGALHLTLIAGYYSKFKPDFWYYQSIWLSHILVLASILALSVFVYMNSEILQRLRYMRAKELNLAHDGFYLVCKKNNLDL